jgi:hypothetical protein
MADNRLRILPIALLMAAVLLVPTGLSQETTAEVPYVKVPAPIVKEPCRDGVVKTYRSQAIVVQFSTIWYATTVDATAITYNSPWCSPIITEVREYCAAHAWGMSTVDCTSTHSRGIDMVTLGPSATAEADGRFSRCFGGPCEYDDLSVSVTIGWSGEFRCAYDWSVVLPGRFNPGAPRVVSDCREL